MTKYAKAIVTGLTAAIVLAAAVGTASAGHFRTSEQRFRVTWAPLHLNAGSLENNCHVTLEGSFHSSTIEKVLESLVGYVTRALVNRCDKPTLTGLNLPWHIRYAGFTGTLPNEITRIRLRLIDASFLIEEIGVSCLYRSTVTRPALGELTLAGGVVSTLTPDPAAQIPRIAGQSIFCPSEGSFSNAGNVTVLGGSARITITLI